MKPENILIDEQGYAKLTDFGLSKRLLPQSSVAHSFCGTPEYVAPEVIKKTGYSYEVDWWALGVLVFEMVTGKTPFSNDSRLLLYKAIQSIYNILSKYIYILDDEPFIPLYLSKSLQNLIRVIYIYILTVKIII